MWTFVEPLCSKRSANFVYRITYESVHRQRKRKQSLERTGFFLSALMLARKLSAAAKSNVSSDIEELLGWPCLLFLLMFTLCKFGPVWILELPNLEVKPAVFLPYFPAYEMTVNFDSNLDKRHLATQENRQVVTAYFKSNTSKGKDTMRPFFFVEDTAGDVKDDEDDN